MAQPQIRLKEFDGEWSKKRLVDTVLLYNGLTYAPSDIKEKGTLVLRSSNVQQDEITLTDNVYVNPLVVNSPFVQKGDIIVVVRNGSRELIGKHAQIKASLDNCVVGAFMAGIRSDNPEFVNALLSTKSFNDEVTKNLGATINQITNGTFRKMEFYFPSLEEQKAIGSYFFSLDELIKASAKKIDSLKRMKVACLQSMFPQPGEATPKIRFKGFTGDWAIVKLSDISKKIIQKNKNMEYKITLTNSAEYGIINQLDFFDHDIANSDNISGYYIVEPGDFVYNPRISTSAPVGPINRNKLGYAGVMSPLYYVFRVKGIDHDYLECFFKTNLWHKFMKDNGNSGARFDRLSITDDIFVQMPIIHPKDRKEQQQIASFFSELDAQIRLHEQKLAKLKQIKASCLDKMFV